MAKMLAFVGRDLLKGQGACLHGSHGVLALHVSTIRDLWLGQSQGCKCHCIRNVWLLDGSICLLAYLLLAQLLRVGRRHLVHLHLSLY